ncbi:MAG: class I SAM-dependent methyltransferase [candidate division KSB1 bacterium]|nr:class I SAM-dependent methyltransferase [candidate division KSB1 bacterium]
MFGYFLRQENASAVDLFSKVPAGFRHVFDLGTGSGNMLACLSTDVDKFGFDLNRAMLRYAKDHSEARFIQCDVKKLPLKDGCGEVMLLIGVLEYIQNPDDVFSEFRRVAARGSHVIFTFTQRNLMNVLRNVLGHRVHTMKFNEIEEKIADYGFRVIHSHRLKLQTQLLIEKI